MPMLLITPLVQSCTISPMAVPDIFLLDVCVPTRPAQLAELPHSEFGPELFPHSAYVKFFVTFATKKPYKTFWDKI